MNTHEKLTLIGQIERMSKRRRILIDQYLKIAYERLTYPYGSKESFELGVIEFSLLDDWCELNDEIIALKEQL